jgi:hypothetical protein
MNMKLYKFRPLAKEEDFQRAKSIIETGRFWCSRFSELNDPMEGVFCTKDHEIIDEVYKQKNLYKICSFSAEAAFKHPCMWGYYANGFKGIAIEIEVDDGEVKKIGYKNDRDTTNDSKPDAIEAILTTKLTSWKYEAEYRFLKESKENEHSIGKITAVYFGEPYGDFGNKQTIYKANTKLQCYQCLSRKLIKIVQDHKQEHKIKCFSVRIENGKGKVQKDAEINQA